jgi:hypothetical protein
MLVSLRREEFVTAAMLARGDGSNTQTGDLLDDGLGDLIESFHDLRHCRRVASGNQENARHRTPKNVSQMSMGHR